MDLPTHIRQIYAHATKLYSKEEVEQALDQLALQINSQLADTNPIFLCLVVGGIVPLGNLLPRLDFPLEVDYVHVTRYKGELKAGELEWRETSCRNLKDRTVIIVDDILDSGLTLAAVTEYCKKQQAKSIYTAVLVDKNDARDPKGLPHADFTGLFVDNVYVFGYGLDYREYLRNAPGIFAVSAETM